MQKLKLACALFGAALSVSAAAPTEFDAASIRLNTTPNERGSRNFTPGRFTATALNLRSLILLAYDLKDYQLSAGPSWITSETYDVTATAASPATEPELRVMLQALLRDRFQLTLHREQKEFSVYALVVLKNGPGKTGPKLQPADSKSVSGPQLASTGVGLSFKNTSMSSLADFVSNLSPVDNRPVLDKTGLSGTYDFTLLISDSQVTSLPPDQSKRAIFNWPSLFTDLQEQLGLKLDPQKAQADFATIDHVAKPSEN
ncbi:MAG TPA: TIGR03435 family protein [Bryobacteraceae bacterium]|jgi:uncharacterized protein (TIGR03435 family)